MLPRLRLTSPASQLLMRGTLFIVAAPSGAGKSSIVNACLARDPNIALSISFTSRAPRPGERHAQHYHFVGADEFQRMIDAGDFFEHALVHGDLKGTARQSVEPQLAAGRDVLLEIDWQGAREVNACASAARTAKTPSHAGSPPPARRCRITTNSIT
jgi:guanylate kinase